MNMKNQTPEQAQAITNLRSNPDFMVFVNYIGDFTEDLLKALLQNPKLENPEFHRGMAGGITEVVNAVEKAPKVLEQHKNKT